jgi:hypothetical protein
VLRLLRVLSFPIVLSLACAGCSAGHPAAAPGTGRAAALGRHAGRAGPQPDVAAFSGLFCARPPSPALRADLGHAVPESLRSEIIPQGLLPGGHAAYVSIWTPAFAGVAALDLATGSIRKIQPFGNPVTDQADGSSDGRWLVWEETYSLQSLDDFTVYAWDSATGRLLRLGHSLAGPGRVPWPSPWHAPAVSGDFAAWAQGYGPGGEVEIRLANLATGQVQVIRSGHVQPPFFDGSLVVWPESGRPGAQTTLRAVSMITGRAAALPPVLRPVHGTEFVATDGTRTAYLSPDLTRLYYSPAPAQQARLALRLPAGVDFADLAMGAGWLAWTTTSATYLASPATGSYSQVTPEYGIAAGSGSKVLISDAAERKAASSILPMHVADAADLTGPGCGAGQDPQR